MKKAARNRKIYSDGRHLYSAEEIVPLGFALNDEEDQREAERQLKLSIKEFNKLAREGGYTVLL